MMTLMMIDMMSCRSQQWKKRAREETSPAPTLQTSHHHYFHLLVDLSCPVNINTPPLTASVSAFKKKLPVIHLSGLVSQSTCGVTGLFPFQPCSFPPDSGNSEIKHTFNARLYSSALNNGEKKKVIRILFCKCVFPVKNVLPSPCVTLPLFSEGMICVVASFMCRWLFFFFNLQSTQVLRVGLVRTELSGGKGPKQQMSNVLQCLLTKPVPLQFFQCGTQVPHLQLRPVMLSFFQLVGGSSLSPLLHSQKFLVAFFLFSLATDLLYGGNTFYLIAFTMSFFFFFFNLDFILI